MTAEAVAELYRTRMLETDEDFRDFQAALATFQAPPSREDLPGLLRLLDDDYAQALIAEVLGLVEWAPLDDYVPALIARVAELQQESWLLDALVQRLLNAGEGAELVEHIRAAEPHARAAMRDLLVRLPEAEGGDEEQAMRARAALALLDERP